MNTANKKWMIYNGKFGLSITTENGECYAERNSSEREHFQHLWSLIPEGLKREVLNSKATYRIKAPYLKKVATVN